MKESDQIFDAAGRVLTAAEHNTELASDAIQVMNDAVAKLERMAEESEKQIRQKIEASLESSIGSAVSILIQKFQDVDKYADQAARRYEKAVQWATWKVFAVAVMVGLSIIGGAVLLLRQTIPTYSEIISLRAEKQQLEAAIASLEKRGARIQLNDCLDKQQRKRLCAKIDEKAPQYTNGFRALAGY